MENARFRTWLHVFGTQDCAGTECPSSAGHCTARCGAGHLCEFCATIDTCVASGCRWELAARACASLEAAGVSLAPLVPGLDPLALAKPEVVAHLLTQLQGCTSYTTRGRCREQYLCEWTRICQPGFAQVSGA